MINSVEMQGKGSIKPNSRRRRKQLIWFISKWIPRPWSGEMTFQRRPHGSCPQENGVWKTSEEPPSFSPHIAFRSRTWVLCVKLSGSTGGQWEGPGPRPQRHACSVLRAETQAGRDARKTHKFWKWKGNVQTFAGTRSPIYSCQLFTQWGHFLEDGGGAICATCNPAAVLFFIWKNVLSADEVRLHPDGGLAVITQAECHHTHFPPPTVLPFFCAGCQSDFITKDWAVYKEILTLKRSCHVTILYIPSREEQAFFTGRSLSLLNGFCRFLPVSSPYPRVRRTVLHTQAFTRCKWKIETKVFNILQSVQKPLVIVY